MSYRLLEYSTQFTGVSAKESWTAMIHGPLLLPALKRLQEGNAFRSCRCPGLSCEVFLEVVDGGLQLIGDGEHIGRLA